MKAVRLHAPGGPEDLRYEDVPRPLAKAGEAVVKIEATGVNYIDILFRIGHFKTVMPCILGYEAAGIVDEVGDDVGDVSPGDRVAYTSILGSYAEYAAVPASRLVPLPSGLSTHAAAAGLFQGITAHFLSHDTYALKPGDTALIHAAAGGVGLLLVQMAKRQGAKVFGTVSTQSKVEAAREAGADEVIVYTQQDFSAEVRRFTRDRGVQVVYDSIGKATFDQSLDCLAPRGCLALFGQVSGNVPPLDVNILGSKGSLFLTRPAIMHHIASREELLRRADDVLTWIVSGQLRLRINDVLPLEEAAEAHRRLEDRRTTGKLLLVT